MTANQKAEAVTAMKVAIRLWNQKNYDKALKFIAKSLRMHPTPEAQLLQEKWKRMRSKGYGGGGGGSRTNGRRRSSTNGPAEQEELKFDDPEIMEIVQQKDYYAIFGLPKDFSATKDLTRSWHKLTKKFHPDRNKKPGAEAATQLINKAYETLKDPEKRRLYDLYGTDAPQAGPGGFRRGRRHPTPEDIFREFFFNGGHGGGFSFHHHHHGTAGRPHPQNTQARPLSTLMQLLPMLLVLLFSVLGSFGGNDSSSSHFSFERDGVFTSARETSYGIPYFVPRDFERIARYRMGYLEGVEDLVETAHLKKLEETCKSQQRERERLVREAERDRSPDLPKKLRRAHEHPLTACEELEDYVESRIS